MGQQARAATLALLAELTDAQLLEKVPGAPRADGTIGGMLAIQGDHPRVHYTWLKEGFARAQPLEFVFRPADARRHTADGVAGGAHAPAPPEQRYVFLSHAGARKRRATWARP